jgi:hypothetical protein
MAHKKVAKEVLSPEDMRNNLIAWNPNWNETTVFGYANEQLVAIYKKERTKTMEFINEKYPLH